MNPLKELPKNYEKVPYWLLCTALAFPLFMLAGLVLVVCSKGRAHTAKRKGEQLTEDHQSLLNDYAKCGWVLLSPLTYVQLVYEVCRSAVKHHWPQRQ